VRQQRRQAQQFKTKNPKLNIRRQAPPYSVPNGTDSLNEPCFSTHMQPLTGLSTAIHKDEYKITEHVSRRIPAHLEGIQNHPIN
jgi:hypothetical protein